MISPTFAFFLFLLTFSAVLSESADDFDEQPKLNNTNEDICPLRLTVNQVSYL